MEKEVQERDGALNIFEPHQEFKEPLPFMKNSDKYKKIPPCLYT